MDAYQRELNLRLMDALFKKGSMSTEQLRREVGLETRKEVTKAMDFLIRAKMVIYTRKTTGYLYELPHTQRPKQDD